MKQDLRIAVITPYHKESLKVLKRCHDSVKAQTYSATHIMVADGCPRNELDDWDIEHYKLQVAHADYGNTPRCLGALSAYSLGFDAILFLDADNWFELDHIETLVSLQKKYQVQVVTAARNFRRVDGSFMYLCHESNGITFNDTNCYLLMREVFDVNMVWVFPDMESVVGDRSVWAEIVKRNYTRIHSTKPTVNYVTTNAMHYLALGEKPPKNAKIIQRTKNRGYQMVPYLNGRLVSD